MGRLELPLPQLGKGKQSLESVAKEMQKKIRARVPKDLRDSVIVKPFKSGDRSGITIDYDDRAEGVVYVSIEYPAGSGKEETAEPEERTR